MKKKINDVELYEFMHKLDCRRFAEESDRIEGETWNDDYGVLAIQHAIDHGFHSVSDFLNVHSILGKRINEPWVGKLRNVNVRVGSYVAPPFSDVPVLMRLLVEALPAMDSWEAHNTFEKIHPFQDMNGRMGRILWLTKAIEEGYRMSVPFLQQYYYQTLRHDSSQ